MNINIELFYYFILAYFLFFYSVMYSLFKDKILPRTYLYIGIVISVFPPISLLYLIILPYFKSKLGSHIGLQKQK